MNKSFKKTKKLHCTEASILVFGTVQWPIRLSQSQHWEFHSLKKKPYLQRVTIIVFVENIQNGLNINTKPAIIIVTVSTREQFRKVNVTLHHGVSQHQNKTKTLNYVSWAENKATLALKQNLFHRLRNDRCVESHRGEFKARVWNGQRLRSELGFGFLRRRFNFSPQFRSKESKKKKSQQKKKMRERVVDCEERSVRSLNTVWVRYGRVRTLRNHATAYYHWPVPLP